METNYDDAFVIDVDTTDAVEMGPVEPGEYKLQCIKAEGKGGTDKNGNAWQGISLLFDIPDVISAGLVNYMVFVPRATGTEKQNAQNISRFDKFKRAFGFGPADKFTPNDLVGREVFATLIQVDDPEYGLQNKIQSWIVSH